MLQLLTLDEVAHVIALAAAPAFLLGGIVGFLSLLTAGMARIVDRARALHEVDAIDGRRQRLKADMPELRRRARLIHISLSLSILSAVITALLIVTAFVGALLKFKLETIVGTLFVLSLMTFIAALVFFVREATLSLLEFRHYEKNQTAPGS